MGSGAYMQVFNSTTHNVTIWITNINCMHDGGAEGSNLQVFNGAEIRPGQLFPPHRQYIEADGSGGCWFVASYFNLGWAGREATISVSSGRWDRHDVPGIAIKIDQDTPQATITGTLYIPGSPEAAEFEEPAAT